MSASKKTEQRERIAHSVADSRFRVDWHYMTGQVESLHRVDATPMYEWIRGRFGLPCGACYLDKRFALENGIRQVYEYMEPLRLTVERRLTEEGYVERYRWQNVGKEALSVESEQLGVYVTMAERYDIDIVGIPYRSFTHCFCAHSVFYLYNARCDGSTDGVGLVMRTGCVASVGEERLDPRQRGDLIAWLPSCTLQPDESVDLEWLVFGYADQAEFWRVVTQYAPRIRVSPLCPVPHQTVRVEVGDEIPATVWVNGVEVANPFLCPEGEFLVSLPTAETGYAPYVEGQIAPPEAPGDAQSEEGQVAQTAEEEGREPPVETEETPAREGAPLASHAIYWSMSGLSVPARWASWYHRLGRSKNNPRHRLVACDAAMRRYQEEMQTALQEGREPDPGALQEAVGEMLRYYRHEGGTLHADMGLPVTLLRHNETVRAYFVKQWHNACNRRHPLWSRQWVLGMQAMCEVAAQLEMADADKQNAYTTYAQPLLHTWFGDLF